MDKAMAVAEADNGAVTAEVNARNQEESDAAGYSARKIAAERAATGR
jgi:hypothetical protein